jgi:predicted CXXCH cytochrome family protein
MVSLAFAAWALRAGAARPEPPAPSFVGAARCGSCHAAIHAKWKSGRHSRMLQAASAENVKGDFAAGAVTLRGLRYTLHADGGAWFVGESYLEGRPARRRVDFTLGNRRVQHYLSRLDDGRIVVLPPSWDVQRREWFHNLDIVDLEESGPTRVQVWNAHCHGCHVSGQEKNFASETGTYRTRWSDFGTSCERCHGPGARHAEADGLAFIVRPSALGPEGGTAVCAQCHSLRDVVAGGFTAGADYADHFMPILEYAQKQGRDPAYWADGRPRRFSNDAIGLWQSDCFVKGGATCGHCHDPHRPDVDTHPALAAAASERLCARCHPDQVRDAAAHTRHREGSAGRSCVECHMPRTVVSLKATMRDHAIGPPVPEATVRFGVPNACNACHAERSAAWARDTLRRWGADRRAPRHLRRAEAFVRARRGADGARALLLALAQDGGEPPLVRANAVGHLRRFGGPEAAAALSRALADPAPVVRAVAALTLSERKEAAADALPGAVRDPRASVRVAAAFALMSRGVRALPGELAAPFAAAKDEYVRRAELLPDDAPTQLELGKFLFLDRRYAQAGAAFAHALRLRGDLPGGRYLLALARVGEGRAADARAALRLVPSGDPHAAQARALLKTLPAE